MKILIQKNINECKLIEEIKKKIPDSTISFLEENNQKFIEIVTGIPINEILEIIDNHDAGKEDVKKEEFEKIDKITADKMMDEIIELSKRNQKNAKIKTSNLADIYNAKNDLNEAMGMIIDVIEESFNRIEKAEKEIKRLESLIRSAKINFNEVI